MRQKKWLKRGLVILAVLVIAGGLVKYGWQRLNAPAEGSITINKQDEQTVTNSSSYTSLSTHYFNLLYPSQFNQDYHQPAAAALDYYYLETANARPSSLEIYLRNLAHGGVTLDPNYKQYATDSSYRVSNKPVNNDIVDYFTQDKPTSERVVLWAHGQYLLVIKLTGTPEKQPIDQTLKTIIDSVSWTSQ